MWTKLLRKRTYAHCWEGYKSVLLYAKQKGSAPKKTKNRTTLRSRNFITGHIAKEHEIHVEGMAILPCSLQHPPQ